MNDFKSYSQNGKNRNTPYSASGGAYGTGAQGSVGGSADLNNGGGNSGNNSTADFKQTTDMVAMVARAFNGKSEGQILQTILAQAEEGKRNGTLTNADLDNFYSTVAPMLDGFKRKKLKEIIARLKAI